MLLANAPSLYPGLRNMGLSRDAAYKGAILAAAMLLLLPAWF